MPCPIGNTDARLRIGPVLWLVSQDLDPEHPVREVAVVESEPEIGVRRRYTAREIRLHHRPRVEQIRTRIQSSHFSKSPQPCNHEDGVAWTSEVAIFQQRSLEFA